MFWEFKKGEKKTKKINPNWQTFGWFFLVFVILSGFILYSSAFNFQGIGIFNQNFSDLFNPVINSTFFAGQNLFLLSLKLLFETLIYVSAGTFLGFMIALVSAYLGSKFSPLKKLNLLLNIILIVLRSLPILFFLQIFSNSFNDGWATFLIYSWFTWLWIHKYLINIFNNVSLKFYHLAIQTGSSKIKAFYGEIYLRMITRIISLYMTAFESNIRWLTLLSRFGIFTIGYLIVTPLESVFKYNELLIPLLIYILMVISLDLINTFFVKNVFIAKTKKVNFEKDLIKQKPKLRIIFTFLILIITLTFVLLIFFRLENDFKNIGNFSHLIAKTFGTFPTLLFNLYNWNISPIILMMEVLFLGLISISISGYFGFWLGVFQGIKINNKYQVYTLRIITTFFRAIPLLFILLFTNTLWISNKTVLLYTLIFHQMFSISKYVSNQVNTIEKERFDNLKIQGYSYWKIIMIFIFPSVKKDYLDYIYFKYGDMVRYIIFLGIYGGLIIGQLIDIAIEHKNYVELISYVYVIMFTIISLEYLNIFLKNKHYLKIKKFYYLSKNLYAKKILKK